MEDIFEPEHGVTALAPAVVRATDLTGVHVLKHENLFMLCNAHGDIRPDGRGLGLFDGDTRLLSTYDLHLNGLRPVVLRTGPAASYQCTIQLTNPDMVSSSLREVDGSEVVLRRQSLGVVRERVVAGGFAERVTVTNYTMATERARLTLELDADYADIFELRGLVRDGRGERLANRQTDGHIVFGYRGLDGVVRRTHVESEPPMALNRFDEHGQVVLEADWNIPPGGSQSQSITIWTEPLAPVAGDDGDEAPIRADVAPFVNATQPQAVHRAWRQSSAVIETSNKFAERALERASGDLRLLVNAGPGADERYLAAGVPWFSCPFGRDSIITSLQLLCIRPQIAQSTLSLLARLQATEIDEFRDAQPGKILHELRSGELARTGEIPHTPYYGTVDATPLWLILLDEYERWTGDVDLVERLWPNALAALNWIDEFGDLDGDGFVEYERQSRRGLANQGWKDSADAIRRSDGTLAEGPIALVEVQGYVYAARRAVARLARQRGELKLAAEQEVKADELRARFEQTFWMRDVGTYALALDGEKQIVDGIASNAGHALWSGIVSPERAAGVARVLTENEMFSGWGIRTLSSEMTGYNPIGYHLGTIWPHDNAICVAGFARYGQQEEARLVAGALLEATMHFREARLPELFCGFDRATSPLPVPYPVACAPQAWAAGALFHIISATLGMHPNARDRTLELLRPSLPDWLPELLIRNLRVGDALVDVAFAGSDGSISVEVLRRTGDLDVVVRL
jgi:glycogen debranching enzyme